jgi:hypothetical protein
MRQVRVWGLRELQDKVEDLETENKGFKMRMQELEEITYFFVKVVVWQK